MTFGLQVAASLAIVSFPVLIACVLLHDPEAPDPGLSLTGGFAMLGALLSCVVYGLSLIWGF